MILIKKIIRVIDILMILNGILVFVCMLSLLIFKILNKIVDKRILIVDLDLSKEIVILLNLIDSEVVWMKKFWYVFNFLIILLSFVKVLEMIIDKMIVCLLFIFVYLEVKGFKLMEWILNFKVVFFINS